MPDIPTEYLVTLSVTRDLGTHLYETREEVTVYAHTDDEAGETAINKVMEWPEVVEAEVIEIEDLALRVATIKRNRK